MMAKAWRWRPGIALQLALSFVGVGGLILTANLAVQQTIRITTTRVQTVAPVAVAPPPRVAAPLPVAQPVDEPALVVDSDLERRVQALLRASEHFESEVALRAGTTAPGNLGSSADALRSAATDALREEAQRRRINTRIAAYLRAGEELVARSEQRRRTFQDYLALIESMGVRLQRPIDGAWKIMGRVIARQSLLTVNQRFAEIRRSAAAFATSESYDQELLTELTANEQAFAGMLAAQGEPLARSQGAEWLAGLQRDAAHMIELRTNLTSLDARSVQDREQLQAEGAALRTLLATVPAQALARARTARRAARAAVAARPVAAPVESVAVPLAAAPAATPLVVAAPVDDQVSTEVDEGNPAARRRLAWLSVLTLALLLGVLTATVLGIVVPVRRLIRATQRIAKGDVAARVPRGGSKELDALAVSFNDMAEQLWGAQRLARDYHQRLEADVAERTRQLQHLVEHDALTELPNRRQLISHLTAGIATAARHGQHVGLFFLDLDNFKNINEGMGHFLGDRVLEAVAARLREVVGPGGFAARLSGDDFTVVCSATTQEDAAQTGWALVRAFQKPLELDGREMLVSVSIGASFYPAHAADADSLLRAADAALYRAKALGRSQLTVFTPELLESAAAKFSTEQGLRHAVERGELELVFQPEVSIATLETTVVEALLRWRTRDGVQLSPAAFLAVAEESGLIIQINDWVLRAGVSAAARWYHGGWSTVRVAINVSSRQLFDLQFPDRVQALLEEFVLPPQCLEIELTETVLQTGPTTIAALRRLQALGLSIALDDFGTGYSSLASLEQLPLDRVKLDRSLIAAIDTNARSAAIASAIVRLCRDLGMQITAEGVERPEQLAALRDSGVHIQGFLIARPMAEADVQGAVATLAGHVQNLLLNAPMLLPPPLLPVIGEVATPSDTQRRRALRLGFQG